MYRTYIYRTHQSNTIGYFSTGDSLPRIQTERNFDVKKKKNTRTNDKAKSIPVGSAKAVAENERG